MLESLATFIVEILAGLAIFVAMLAALAGAMAVVIAPFAWLDKFLRRHPRLQSAIYEAKLRLGPALVGVAMVVICWAIGRAVV
ncbi:hypothetical protein [Sphingomonas sanxanigenens]|uniref:Uncharacterized protein n=1 Tax=Sphingomonas sanxanigenens DSM 19645 = NX02 TaxID=1123269 RepID=W0AG27_9SPHN|nr:hypothetical protein [Sphingomonas sanxanigenens]AHE56056.1 hypothetical protein NX02_22155 [Sphingomonas sanxanigenens DSM 19645 = NX02]